MERGDFANNPKWGTKRGKSSHRMKSPAPSSSTSASTATVSTTASTAASISETATSSSSGRQMPRTRPQQMGHKEFGSDSGRAIADGSEKNSVDIGGNTLAEDFPIGGRKKRGLRGLRGLARIRSATNKARDKTGHSTGTSTSFCGSTDFASGGTGTTGSANDVVGNIDSRAKHLSAREPGKVYVSNLAAQKLPVPDDEDEVERLVQHYFIGDNYNRSETSSSSRHRTAPPVLAPLSSEPRPPSDRSIASVALARKSFRQSLFTGPKSSSGAEAAHKNLESGHGPSHCSFDRRDSLVRYRSERNADGAMAPIDRITMGINRSITEADETTRAAAAAASASEVLSSEDIQTSGANRAYAVAQVERRRAARQPLSSKTTDGFNVKSTAVSSTSDSVQSSSKKTVHNILPDQMLLLEAPGVQDPSSAPSPVPSPVNAPAPAPRVTLVESMDGTEEDYYDDEETFSDEEEFSLDMLLDRTDDEPNLDDEEEDKGDVDSLGGGSDPDNELHRYQRYLRRLSDTFSINPKEDLSRGVAAQEDDIVIEHEANDEHKEEEGKLRGEGGTGGASDYEPLDTQRNTARSVSVGGRLLLRCLSVIVTVFLALFGTIFVIRILPMPSIFESIDSGDGADEQKGLLVPTNDTPEDSMQSHPHHPSVLALLTRVTPREVLEAQGSPQQNAMKWLMDDRVFQLYLNDMTEGTPVETEVLERYAATTFFYAAGGPKAEVHVDSPGAGWTESQGWLSDASLCDWHGVTCVANSVMGHALMPKSLLLPGNNLRGTIANEVGLLKTLENIDLSNNFISGELPAGLGSLPNVSELRLGSNRIAGYLDTEFVHNIGALAVLVLERNQMTGSIPPTIGYSQSLYVLRLGNNNFSGEIPTEIGQLHSLYELDLSNNELEDRLPGEIGQLAQLHELKMGGNALYGPIPDTFMQLKEVVNMHFNDNALEGTIPPWIGELQGLRTLYLDQNLFSGELPYMGSLTNLEELALEDNLLTGTVPPPLCGLNLRFLSADCSKLACPCCTNCFEGNETYGGADYTEINAEDLSANFDHTYDSELGLLTELTPIETFQLTESPQRKALEWLKGEDALALYTKDGPEASVTMEFEGTPLKLLLLERYAMATLFYSTGGETSWIDSSNWLSRYHLCDWFGVVCSTTGKERIVKEIHLADNHLTGPLPNEIQAFSNLEMLDLSFNKLEGKIPDGLGKLLKLGALALHENGLTGAVPSSLCDLDLVHFSADCLSDKVFCSCCTSCFHQPVD